MSARRAPIRALVAGGFALCLALAPGTAVAEDDPAAPEPVAEVLEGDQGGERPQDVEQGDVAQRGVEQQDVAPQDVEEPATEREEPPGEEPPPFEMPPEVIAAVQQFAEQAGFPEDCVTGVTEAVELIGDGIAGLPAEVEQLGTDLAAAAQQSLTDGNADAMTAFLEGLAPTPPGEGSQDPPALPIGGDIAAGLQQLAETLRSETCRPAPPTEEPPTQNPPSNHRPPPPAPAQAPQAPIRSVVYPGYAPTGAEEVDEPSPTPIAIAIGVAVLAGSLAWSGRHGRAARSD